MKEDLLKFAQTYVSAWSTACKLYIYYVCVCVCVCVCARARVCVCVHETLALTMDQGTKHF